MKQNLYIVKSPSLKNDQKSILCYKHIFCINLKTQTEGGSLN